MNPLVLKFGNDGYPGIQWTQDNTTIGSFGSDTRFRMGVSGGAFVAQNTAPPYDTQIDLYSQTMLSAQAEFDGTPAQIAAAIVEAYEWELRNIQGMTGVSGVTTNTWNAFNASGYDTATFVIDSGAIATPSYTIRIREKATGTVVASFNYDLDGH